MNLRIILTGVVGGVLCLAALALPFYYYLPAQYGSVQDWFTVSESVAVTGYVLAGLLGIATGYVAARWGWMSSPEERIRAGALAGLLAAMIVWPWLGAPLGGILGSQLLYVHGARPAGGDKEAVFLICEAVVGVAWWTYLLFVALALAASVLGAVGGWIYARWGGKAWGETPPVATVEPFDAGFGLLVSVGLALAVCIASMYALRTNADRSVAQYGFQLSFPTAGITGWIFTADFLLLLLLTWFCGRWCARRWAHPVPGIQRVARSALYGMALMPILVLGFYVPYAAPGLFTDMWFLPGAACWLVVTAYWVYRAGWDARPPDEKGLSPAPSLRDRLLVNAGLVTVFMPAFVMLTGVSNAVSLALGVVLYIGVLFSKNPNPLKPSTSASMHQIFTAHWFYCQAALVVWLVLALLHAGAVVWWQKRRARRQAQG